MFRHLLKKLRKAQIVGFILFVLGIYLFVTSIQSIHAVCGKCEKGHHLGLLGIINPVLGLAQFAEKQGTKFKNFILVPLIAGNVLIITGVLLVVLCRKKTHPPT